MRVITSYIIGALLMISVVVAFSTVEITAPTSFTYQSSLQVNVSCGINISGFPYLYENINFSSRQSNVTSQVVNVTILNKSSEAGNYTILTSSLPLTVNASNGSLAPFWNFTATLADGRHWLKCNYTNASRNAAGDFISALTAERIVQIDIERDVFGIMGGTINFSTNGDINTSGLFHTNKGIVTAEAGATSASTCTNGEIRGNWSGTDQLCLCVSAAWECVAVS